VLPAWTVNSIVVAKGGAHPSYAHGYYVRDNQYYKNWDAISRDRESFSRWLQSEVLQVGGE
jgi:glutaconate CoA-transferase subunit A